MNIEKYGQPTAPEYDMSKIENLPISLICGKTDMLSSPQDYKNLKELLTKNGNDVDFKEFDVGHLGILCPKDESIVDDILSSVLKYKPSDNSYNNTVTFKF